MVEGHIQWRAGWTYCLTDPAIPAMSDSGTVTHDSHPMSSTARSARVRWPGGPGHRLDHLSLTDLRNFYNDPSAIGWTPYPSLDVDRFKASFRLEHTIETHYRVDGCPTQIHARRTYRASGSFAPPSSLDFIGTKTGSHVHETCTVGLGPECVEFFRANLFDDSKAYFNRCVSERQDHPSLITHDFAGGYEDMIEGLLAKMLSPDRAKEAGARRAIATGATNTSDHTAGDETAYGQAGPAAPLPAVWRIVHKSSTMTALSSAPGSWVCPGDVWQVEIDYTLHLPSSSS